MLRLQEMQIRAFKGFKALDLKLGGRDLLVYGANGSGKSSLYWALYTFFQSAEKETEEVAKYFDPDHSNHLLHIHSPQAEQEAACLSLAFQNRDASVRRSYTIARTQHETRRQADLLKANLASDFVTYRILFNFYNFKNSESIDLWPVFEREILPFCRTTLQAEPPAKSWRLLQEQNPREAIRREGRRGTAAAQVYKAFDEKIDSFNLVLQEILATISTEAQTFYNKHFQKEGEARLGLSVNLTRGALRFDRTQENFTRPVIGLEIQLGGRKLHKPQSFLNEAKLTQLALSVRFGATLAHLQESPIKLLVLDDLLISLDMSNRMKVVDILLSETFAGYQKMILTHDLGFFREFQRRIGSQHTDWSFQSFVGTAEGGIALKKEKTDLQKAEDYLHGQDLEEAAIFLRKAAEDMAKRYREWATKKKIPPGEFLTLTENLRAARNKMMEKLLASPYKEVLEKTRKELWKHLISAEDGDIESLPLSPEDRGRLKTQRKRLRDLLNEQNWEWMESVRLMDQILESTERVLNPGAHDRETPLYEGELRYALELVQKLDRNLASLGSF